jgi:nucleosome binding factor SPN SPT16 subunit
VAYRSPAEVPSDRAREALIVVDRAKEAVLLPIYGQLVPFHICTIKNCTATQEGSAHFIRIYFNVPGAAFGGAGYAPGAANPDATFLREGTFRSADGRHASNVVSEIKTLRAAAKQRTTEAAERAKLVRQDKLQLAKGRVHRLADVWVRPAFDGRGRKLSGTLECHANGFRYSTPKSEERLDIIFSNIKHAFFQPSEKELITLVHFHLIEPIMVGKKKTHDVQVSAQVMDAVQNLDGGRRSLYDPDEIEDEQRERERRNRVNADFAAFTQRVQELWNKDFNDLVRDEAVFVCLR